ncbi:Hpt domain-containing protein [Acetobacteraceae bacterium H6797]|nr:Hpt domain-containing protein [Acetobacteraceae bacterium H6797]
MSAIDPEIAGQLATDLPRDVFRTIVQTFEVDLARLVSEMIAAVKANDLEEYRRGAHGLAGAAGAIGARDLERAARRAMDPKDQTPPVTMIRDIGSLAQAALTELSALAREG